MDTTTWNIKKRPFIYCSFAVKLHVVTTLTKSTPERTDRYFSDLSLCSDSRDLPPPSLHQKTFILQPQICSSSPPTPLCDYLIEDWPVSGSRGAGVSLGICGELLWCEIFFLLLDWWGLAGYSWRVILFRRPAFVISRHSLQFFEEKQKAHSSNSFPQLLVLWSVSVSRCVPVSPCRPKLKQLCSQACWPKAESSGVQIPNQGWWRACVCAHVFFLPNSPPELDKNGRYVVFLPCLDFWPAQDTEAVFPISEPWLIWLI